MSIGVDGVPAPPHEIVLAIQSASEFHEEDLVFAARFLGVDTQRNGLCLYLAIYGWDCLLASQSASLCQMNWREAAFDGEPRGSDATATHGNVRRCVSADVLCFKTIEQTFEL